MHGLTSPSAFERSKSASLRQIRVSITLNWQMSTLSSGDERSVAKSAFPLRNARKPLPCKQKPVMSRIRLLQGDITQLSVDAIVNAANAGLRGGGGVDGAIHSAGGPTILAECREIISQRGPLSTGEAVITTAGDLAARYVIHTVGPIWDARLAEQHDQLLADAYRNSLSLAVQYELRTIAFPNISTGVYGFPKDRAAQVAVRAVREFLADDDFLQEVVFVCFGEENYAYYQQLL